MKDVLWNAIILDEFIRLALLTDLEEQILRTQIKGWSRTKQSMEFNISIETVDRVLKTIRRKYDSVQPHSGILPLRKKA